MTGYDTTNLDQGGLIHITGNVYSSSTLRLGFGFDFLLGFGFRSNSIKSCTFKPASHLLLTYFFLLVVKRVNIPVYFIILNQFINTLFIVFGYGNGINCTIVRVL